MINLENATSLLIFFVGIGFFAQQMRTIDRDFERQQDRADDRKAKDRRDELSDAREFGYKRSQLKKKTKQESKPNKK